MAHAYPGAGAALAFIPSPSVSGFHIGPIYLHFYGLMYAIGIALALWITRRRVAASIGEPDLVYEVAWWAVPIGLLGARLYYDVTTPPAGPQHWWWPVAIWSGGLGVWGGIAAGALAGVWRLKRRGAPIAQFADAVAPALLVAQAVGRIGNYFNIELFGKPTTLPWGLDVPPAYRPTGYARYSTFHPTFLYEMIFDLALAAALVWLGHHRRIRAPGLFALYVTGYSAFRIFEESLRIDTSHHLGGLRLNFYVASVLTVAGLAWFVLSQRRPAGVTAGTLAGGDARAQAETAAGASEPDPAMHAAELGASTPAAGPADDAAAGDGK
jgi:prolipoprotein diacylglyceryl transferase